MEPVHSLSVACNIPALPYCVICSGYCCLSGVGYLCCQYPQGEKLFFLKEEFFFKIILACCHVPVHSFYVIAETVCSNSVTSGLQHTCCADRCMERANASKKCSADTYCSRSIHVFSIFAWQQCHNVFTHISMLVS